MALDSASVLLLAGSKSIGADFSDVMMVGRQLFGPGRAVLEKVLAAFNIAEDADALLKNKYADRFFMAMGAVRVELLDLSAYEGASHRHDLNLPLPPELRGRYSLVHDGGTLEHVFNLPQALKNCMEMVRPGGYFTQVSCGNNLMGHGFWQLSPEMIFRVFSPPNGFSVRAVLLHELRRKKRWVVVTDPAAAQRRVELVNDMPTYILTIAQRVAETPVFAVFPRQSDYEVRWRQSESPRARPKTPIRPTPPASRGSAILMKLRRRFWRPPDGFNAAYFRQISADDVMFGRFATA